MKHRIAMVLCSPFPAPRGTQGYVADLAEALLAEGHAVHLFCYAGQLGGHLPEGLVLHRAPKIPGLPAALRSAPSPARPLNDAAVLGRLLAELPALRPTVLHGHHHEGGLAAAFAGRLLGVPVVYQVHGRMAEELPGWLPRIRPLAASAGALLDAVVPRLADRVATLDAVAALQVARRGRTPPVVLPPGVRPFTGRPRTLGAGRWIVYAGNLDPYQGLSTLLGAFAEVSRRQAGTGLAVVTHDAPGRVRRLLRLSTLDGVRAIHPEGPEEALAWMAGARVSVVPRCGDGGYPIKLLNSLGVGVPVVACRPSARGLGEGEGVLVTDPEPLALAEGLLRVLEDDHLHQRLREGALRFAAEHPWSGVARAAALVYDALVR